LVSKKLNFGFIFYLPNMLIPYVKLMKYNYIYFSISLLLLQGCQVYKNTGDKNNCSTKYPIILVHGVSFRDDVPLIKYWGNLPKIMQKHGARIYLSHTNAFASHVENAIQLRDRVLEILEETGAEKVNLIAHSKGGIESRYMISRLGMEGRVASLTTIATPHRGTCIADTIINWLKMKKLIQPSVEVLRTLAGFIGDTDPDPLIAGMSLGPAYMELFNQSVPDMPGVYYQSYGSVVDNKHPMFIVRIQEKILSEKEGPNDCAVSVNSFSWGNFKGLVSGNNENGVSHFDIIGFKIFGKNHAFDADRFFIEICTILKEMGF
jgi:triacylglycerol lipase